MEQQNKMGTAKMGPLIFSMALPAMISMIINALYNIVDSFFVAQISENAMTALSLVFPVQNFRQCDCDWFRCWNQCTDILPPGGKEFKECKYGCHAWYAF